MTTTEAFQRGNNLLAAAIVALSGVAFLPEFFLESEVQFKLDEGVLFILGIAAIAWHLTGRNKFTKSLVPVLLVAGALVIKVIGLILEINEPDDAGDDYGAVILFALATITVIFLYVRGMAAKKESV